MGCEILTHAPAFADKIHRSETIVPSLRNQQNWFAVYTPTHREKSVTQHLTDRGIENFLFEPHPYLPAGMKARIIAGPLAWAHHADAHQLRIGEHYAFHRFVPGQGHGR